jgi:dipeptidyl aminopeptidase/acylaminoacyl peptidase
MLGLLLCLTHAPANARPYTIDDMLKLESYGAVSVDPEERWAFVERRRPYDAGARYDLELRTDRALSRVFRFDLRAPGPLELAFPQEDSAGYWTAGFSPSGRRMAVYRISGDQVSLGIVDLPSRSVRWLEGAVEIVEAAPRPVWIGEESLLYAARPAGGLPLRFSSGEHRRNTDQRLRMTAEGRSPAVRLSGSGSFGTVGVDVASTALTTVHLPSGRRSRLATGSISDFAVSPDNRRVAVLMRDGLVQPYRGRPMDPAFQSRRLRLPVVDLGSGRSVEPCPGCDVLPNLLAWAPAGGDLMFFARPDDRDWRDGQLYRFARAGPAKAVLPEDVHADVSVVRGAAPTVRAGWAGDSPIVLAKRGSGAPEWFRVAGAVARPTGLGARDRPIAATRAGAVAVRPGDIVRVSWEGKGGVESIHEGGASEERGTSSDYGHVGTRLFINPDLGSLAVVRRRRPSGNIGIVEVEGEVSRLAWSATLPTEASVLATAPGIGAVVYFEKSASGVGRLMLSSLGAPARLVDKVNEHLGSVDLPRRMQVTTTVRGQRLTHWLTLPPGSGRVPLVVLPYPGWDRGDGPPPPIDPSILMSYSNVGLLTAAGYAVLEPSLPLESAADRQRTDFGSLGTLTEAARTPDDFAPEAFLDGLTESVLAAVGAAEATGRVDGDALAIYGHSYGAYAAVGIATRTDRFQKVIASAGVYNLLGAYGSMFVRDTPEVGLPTGMFSWFEGGQAGLAVPPWRGLDRYVARSPYFAVDRLKSRLLLIHGEADFIPVGEAERLLMAMHRLGHDALLVRYAGEGHSLASPANIRDQWQRILDFLRTSPDRQQVATADAPAPPAGGGDQSPQ